MTSNTGTDIIIYRDAFYSTSEVPSSSDEQQLIITNNLWASYDNYIQFRYVNNLDANQTGTRTILILVKEFKEGV